MRGCFGRLSREAQIILLIGAVDLTTTLWFVNAFGASEANPVMRVFLAKGILVFAVAKAAFCLAPVLILEWARRQRPLLVQAASRTVIVLYLGLYFVGTLSANSNSATPLVAAIEQRLALGNPAEPTPEMSPPPLPTQEQLQATMKGLSGRLDARPLGYMTLPGQ